MLQNTSYKHYTIYVYIYLDGRRLQQVALFGHLLNYSEYALNTYTCIQTLIFVHSKYVYTVYVYKQHTIYVIHVGTHYNIYSICIQHAL